ncbi:hypothetical protein GCM10017771_12560 [Streptomyces capitiformicae]|uniref:Uncharacterized protein n=1 Tax=Streptomyces capitiformicae TaxID=2014920 RepID=A0A919GHK6_9ACTN|nr:hypothetical protein GCM10017771_12560 [Streptomyces capitiformicae]
MVAVAGATARAAGAKARPVTASVPAASAAPTPSRMRLIERFPFRAGELREYVVMRVGAEQRAAARRNLAIRQKNGSIEAPAAGDFKGCSAGCAEGL